MSNDTEEVATITVGWDAYDDSLNGLWSIEQDCEVLTAEVQRLRQEVALAFGFKCYETKKLPADVLSILDRVDELAQSAEGQAYQLRREMMLAVTEPAPDLPVPNESTAGVSAVAPGA